MAEADQSLEEINKTLVPLMDGIQKSKLSIAKSQKEENIEIFKTFLECLITKMKEKDPLFKVLYQKNYYTGSYYEGLRVAEASEFDVNLILKFPFKSEDREVETGDKVNPQSFARFRLKSQFQAVMLKYPHQEKYKSLEKFFDDKNYLLPERLMSWMQSVVDKVDKEDLNRVKGVKYVTISRHGPAKTVYITTTKGEGIDIDLVPSLEFQIPEWPKGAERGFLNKAPQHKQFWFLIPKPYNKGSSPVEPKDADVPRLWRLHFPEIENILMYNKGCLKTIIKFLKMLEKLDDCVQKQNIPYLFYPKFNLIRGMNPSEAFKIHNRIQKIIKALKKNPGEIHKVFQI
ncbi:cyclic GMP-AMP synthase-like receptor isoform X2 [Tachypleus tridentatus]|uniref:cyclic GMP-AMP synthase-like receptor isoform X2 n=1 Tax=Tachypleus tridentatus TaxID=6853 RepID=UPI003FCFE1F0